MASFTSWLLRQKGRSDLIGVLAKEVVQDPEWPASKDVGTYKAYVQSHVKEPEAKANIGGVVQSAWDEWSRSAAKSKRKKARKASKQARKKNR